MADSGDGKGATRMRAIYVRMTDLYFSIATLVLNLIGGALIVAAIWELGVAALERSVSGVLEAAGLVIIGFAIVETAKFFLEEEVERDRELRSAGEARRSLS